MEKFDGIDLDAAGKVAGNGFYYLMGDIARLHSAVISYARDFMIDRGFTYCVPPFMIRSNVVTGVMSFAEMDAMMYKIEGEDLYLIGTSEHSMIGKFIDTIVDEKELPKTLTSYSPCFRKEKGAHGIEERGVYRIHQFEKQEMMRHGHHVRRNILKWEAAQILEMHRLVVFRFVSVERMEKNILHILSTIQLLHHLECL